MQSVSTLLLALNLRRICDSILQVFQSEKDSNIILIIILNIINIILNIINIINIILATEDQ